MGALDHATAANEIAVAYRRRRRQFGKSLASFQIVQDKLVRMLAEACSMQPYCPAAGSAHRGGQADRHDRGDRQDEQHRKVRQVISETRSMLGGNGIALAEGFEQLSETSRYRRFLTGKPHLSEESLAYLATVDHRDHEALVAVEPDSGQLLGVARFIRDPQESDHAEVAVTATDSWQRRGLGTAPLRELAQRAGEEGIGYFTAEILAENQPMLTLADNLADTETTHEGGTVSALIDLTKTTEQPGTTGYGYYDLLRAAARGEFIGLPAALRGWLDLSGKIIATLLVPVSALCDASRQAAPTASASRRPEGPAITEPDDAST